MKGEFGPRIALIGCGKTKAAAPCAAKDMYRSPLFNLAVKYALRTCDRWYVLSAKHGLLAPTDVIAPYDEALHSMAREDRLAWGRRVGAQIDAAVPELNAEIVFLAGEAYSDPIDLIDRYIYWIEPLTGLGIGQRLSWLTLALQTPAAPAAGEDDK